MWFYFLDLYAFSHIADILSYSTTHRQLTKENVIISFHFKVASNQTGAVKPMSPPPVINLEKFAYKPLKKDPVPLSTRRSKVSCHGFYLSRFAYGHFLLIPNEVMFCIICVVDFSH
jgi:hypothetical protein